MSKVLCIYPHDNSTRFLNRIQNHLSHNLADAFHCYKVKPNQESHDRCIERLRGIRDEELVVFLGHGRSDALYGANSYSNAFISPYYELATDYENDNFINTDNIDVFAGKKVFCLSCNSADGLGKLAVVRGASVFIGFGDIPTDNEVLPEIDKKLPLIIARFKGEITWIVKTSLLHSLRKGYNFYQLGDMVRLLVNHRINENILRHRGLRQRRLLADYLFHFVYGMKLFGDGNQKLLT